MRWYQRAFIALTIGTFLLLQVVMIANNEDGQYDWDGRPYLVGGIAIVLGLVGIVWLIATLVDRHKRPRLTLHGEPIEKSHRVRERHR